LESAEFEGYPELSSRLNERDFSTHIDETVDESRKATQVVNACFGRLFLPRIRIERIGIVDVVYGGKKM
jgi:hypothetical protein